MKSLDAEPVHLPKIIFDGSFYWERIFRTRQYAAHLDPDCMQPAIGCDGSFPIKLYDALSQFDVNLPAHQRE